MQVSIPGKNVRLFYQMMKCLSKISDVVQWEVYADRVSLKGVNNSISAFYSFSLAVSFFDTFVVEGDNYVKVPIKPCLTSFKGMQKIENCVIFLYEKEFIQLEMTSKIGGRKIFKIQLGQEEVSPIRATYDKGSTTCRISTRPKLFDECLNNFSNDTEEVSIVLQTNFIQLKNEFIIDENVDANKKNMNTELIMDVRDFDKYDIESDQSSKLVFGLQEFKSIITFCEFLGQPIQIYLGSPGMPIIVTVKTANLFEADFIVATLQQNPSSPLDPPPVSHHLEHHHCSSPIANISKIDDSGAMWTSELENLGSQSSVDPNRNDKRIDFEDDDEDLVCSNDDENDHASHVQPS